MPIPTRVLQTQAVITPGPDLAARDGNGPLWAYWPTGTSSKWFSLQLSATFLPMGLIFE